MLISIDSLEFGYDDRVILKNLNLKINEGDKIGLVGINGAGKSTLLKIILGELTPDIGGISRKRNLEIGYLKQDTGLESDNTVLNEMRSVFERTISVENKMRDLEHAMADAEDSESLKQLESEYNRLCDFYNAKNGYDIDYKIKSVLYGMGFSDLNKVISTSSGGEKTRLALCKLLLSEPELLILDEPTNYLDFSTLDWLEKYLSDFKGALLIVSHDRYFLDNTVKTIWEIEDTEVSYFKGNYTKYKILKEEKEVLLKKQYEKQQNEIASLKDYYDRNIVRATTAKSAQSRLKALEKIELIQLPKKHKKPRLKFEYKTEPVKSVLTVDNFDLFGGEKKLLSSASLEIKRGEKVAILGDNGTGKSSFIKAIVSKNDSSKNIKWGANASISYFEQETAFQDEHVTVIEELWNCIPNSDRYVVRSVLALLFDEEDVEKTLSQLSGGERAKLAFCKMMVKNSNVLILDEPTNHLDIETREALEKSLQVFTGTIIFVSHDRYFINAVATRIVKISNLIFEEAGFNYDDYLNSLLPEDAKNEIKPEVIKKASDNFRSKEDRKRLVKLKEEFYDTEKAITELETESFKINEILSSGKFSKDYLKIKELSERADEVQTLLNKLYLKWEELGLLLNDK